MFDGPTAAVIVSAILTVGGSIIVAIVKLTPNRSDSEERKSATRLAVVETELKHLRSEFHELRNELRAFAGRPRIEKSG